MIWLIFILSSLLVAYSLFNLYIGYRSIHWPCVVGLVKRSHVISRGNTASSSKSMYYHPTVVYEYEVNNKKYSNNRIGNYLFFGKDEEFANQLISGYPEGNQVKIYYWPVFPKISFLSPGMKQVTVTYILLSMGMVIILVAFPALFMENSHWLIEKIYGIIGHVT